MIKVIKRTGETVSFDVNKIKEAIIKSMKYGSGIYIPSLAKEIADNIEASLTAKEKETVSIFEIEKMVFEMLVSYGERETAKAYEGYRSVQEFKRGSNTTDESILTLIDTSNEEVMRENSNKNGYLLSTQRDLIAGEVSKDLATRKLIPSHIVQAHKVGDIHYHDLDYSIQKMHNCDLVNLEDMLQNGTVVNEKLIERPHSFETACNIATQIMAQVSSSQYGGQSITIRHLAPFLRDSYTHHFEGFIQEGLDIEVAERLARKAEKKSLRDGVQTIRYQLNTISGTNGQSPFATIYLEIIEGDEFEREQALICEEMIKQRLEGMKNYKGQEIGEAFPKLIYVLDEHNCLEGGKYDYITKLAAKCNVKRLVPDYQSAKIMRQNYQGCNFPAMGCRSHLSNWKDENGNFKWYGRFNMGVVSLNLPRIALLADGDMDLMWKILDERLELCKEALLVRYELLKGTKSDVAPILWQHGALARLKKGEVIDPLLEGGYSTISLGYIGIYEMTQAMLGVSHTTEEGEAFAVEVMNRLRSACDKWKAETHLGFGLYGTPAENTVYRFCRLDKQKFGEVKNVTDKLYYTNSYHVNVTEDIDAFAKLKFESQFHAISSGGCISYIEVPDLSNNLEAVEQVINYIYHNVQYAEINTRPDICYVCGYQGEMANDDETYKWFCPNCGNKDEEELQVMRRTCGYIGSSLWSKGRTEEIRERVMHL